MMEGVNVDVNFFWIMADKNENSNLVFKIPHWRCHDGLNFIKLAWLL